MELHDMENAVRLEMVGVSAGSGQIVSYLGQEGNATPVHAGCCLCPAWDIRRAFQQLPLEAPLIDRIVLMACKSYFVRRNADFLRRHSADGVARCLAARSLFEFMQGHAPFACDGASVEAGAKGSREGDFFAQHNPMEFYDGISVPLLIVNACDDILCRPSNIREDLVEQKSGALLLKTQRGAHVAFCEGWLGQGSYLLRMSMDFLEAARSVRRVKKDAHLAR